MSEYVRHPMSFYQDIEACNWSKLKWMRESPAHYRHYSAHPMKDTALLAKGRAVHTLVFEPELFEEEYAVFDGDRKQGKAWDAFEAANEGRSVLKAAEEGSVRAMADSVRRHSLVREYLEGGEFERTLLWSDPVTGLRCKARTDWLQPFPRTLIDLKTSTTSERRRFGGIAGRLGYHCQIGHYVNGVKHALGWEPARVALVVVETSPPFDVAVYFVSPEQVELGQIEVNALLLKLQGCIADDHWPGRYEFEQELHLPPWLFGGEPEITFEDLET